MSDASLQQQHQNAHGNGAGKSLVGDQLGPFHSRDEIIEFADSESTPLSNMTGTLNTMSAADAQQTASVRNKAAIGNYDVLGQVISLLALSPQHRFLFIADLDWRLRPAIMLRQCRLFRRQGEPFAFISWAFVSGEVAGRLQVMPGCLRPDEWTCGKRLTLIDGIAPFGDAATCMREVLRALKSGASDEHADAPQQ